MMALVGMGAPESLLPSEKAEHQPNTVPQSNKQIDLGSVQRTGDNVASPNYGVQTGGHIVGSDQCQIHIASNTHSYNLASGSILNLSTSGKWIHTDDDRMVIMAWLRDLASLDFRCIHDGNLSRRYDQTGAWFLELANFRAWCEGSIRTLWCHGKLGSGKTIISSTVVEYLETDPKSTSGTACLFIFFSHQEKAAQTTYKICVELLRQLVSQQPKLSSDVQRLYSQCKSHATTPSRRHLLNVIQQEIQRFRKVWLVMDAIDECPAHARENTREEFLGVIPNLPTTVSLFITSRHQKYATCDLDPVKEVELTLNDKDLQRYIKGKIREHSSHNEQLALVDADSIIKSVSRNAEGLFLLAHLHMGEIAAQRTPADLQSALENLPSDIQRTYDKAIQRVPVDDLPLAERILLWITFAMRPLTIKELRCALSVKEGVKNASMAERHMFEEGCLAEVCAGLVTVDTEPPRRFVRLVHPTAESYFRSYFQKKKADDIIAATCLQYLLFEDLQPQIHDRTMISLRLQELPLLRYAALHWGDHARSAEDPETVNTILDFLRHKENLASAAQIMDSFDDCDDSVSALWMAAHFGLDVIVDQLLSKHPGTIAETTQGETAMHTAAEKGYISVVARLCQELNVEPDVTDAIGRTPLSLAAENGHDQVVDCLLSSGKVNPDSKTTSAFYQGRTPLSWAAGNGHKATVGHLLDTGQVDADSAITGGPYFGYTPLMWAAANGHANVVDLLLDLGKADPSLEDGGGQTALSWAAQNGHLGAVELLLKTGRAASEKRDRLFNQRPVEIAFKNQHEDVLRLLLTYPRLDLKDQEGRTTLSHEAEHGAASLVKVLLDLGADPNAEDEECWTPLTYAAEKGQVDIVKLLLERGADQRPSIDARTPLSYAAESGHDEMVQLFLAHGAHPDTPDRDGRTPLSYASGAGHEAVVSYLLACGTAVNPNSQSKQPLIYRGRTPLSWAAVYGRVKVVGILLERGADVNLRDRVSSLGPQGPAMLAASQGHKEIVKKLLETGRVELRPEDLLFGQPAAEWALGNGFSFVTIDS